MSVYIPGMEMPKNCWDCPLLNTSPCPCKGYSSALEHTTNLHPGCPLVPVPPHGRLIDADALRARMYHEAFETDTPMQKWDSGCWIRYKMFEQMEESAPTIIEAEEGE